MPTFHLSFDLNSPEDVDELANKLRRLAESLKPEEQKKEIPDGYISDKELMKRIRKKPSTIAVWRGEGMPYLVGKPCSYPWVDTNAWIRKHKVLGEILEQ